MISDERLQHLTTLRDQLKELSEAGFDDMEGADAQEFEIAEQLFSKCAWAAEAIDKAIVHAVKERRISQP